MSATYTVKQVAQILGYSTNSIYTFIKEKRIKAVRVGKGRFRIPQSEIAHLLKTQEITHEPIQNFPTQNAVPTYEIKRPVPSFSVSPILQESERNTFKSIPNFFDWFVGIASIILGAGLSLYSKPLTDAALANKQTLYNALQPILIGGGIGLLVSDLVGFSKSIWHKIFHAILIVSYCALVSGLIQTRDIEGAAIFGSLAFTLLLSFFTNISGTYKYVIYVVILTLTVPAGLFYSNNFSTLFPGITLSYEPFIYSLGSIIVSSIFIGSLYYANKTNKRIFWILLGLGSLFLGMLSVFYAREIFWARALFLLITTVMVLFAPWWETLRFSNYRDRFTVFGVFGIILVLFLSTIAVILLMQRNLLEFTKSQLVDKSSYADQFVQGVMDRTTEALKSSSSNPIIVDILTSNTDKSEKEEKKQKDTLISISRSIFEANKNLEFVLILDKNGTIISNYPYMQQTMEGISLSDNSYVKQILNLKQAVISDISVLIQNHPSVTIGVPVLSSDKELLGVVIGSLDLPYTSEKLQQTGTTALGEQFMITNQKGTLILHPNKDRIQTTLETFEQIESAISQTQPVIDSYDTSGNRTMVVVKPMEGREWVVIVSASYTSILHPTMAATFSIYIVIFLMSFIIAYLLLTRHRTREKT